MVKQVLRFRDADQAPEGAADPGEGAAGRDRAPARGGSASIQQQLAQRRSLLSSIQGQITQMRAAEAARQAQLAARRGPARAAAADRAAQAIAPALPARRARSSSSSSSSPRREHVADRRRRRPRASAARSPSRCSTSAAVRLGRREPVGFDCSGLVMYASRRSASASRTARTPSTPWARRCRAATSSPATSSSSTASATSASTSAAAVHPLAAHWHVVRSRRSAAGMRRRTSAPAASANQPHPRALVRRELRRSFHGSRAGGTGGSPENPRPHACRSLRSLRGEREPFAASPLGSTRSLRSRSLLFSARRASRSPPAKCSSITRRFSFSVGVISPSSAEKSRGRIAKRLICSKRESGRLTSSTSRLDELLAGRGRRACDGLVVEGDERRDEGPAVADDERVRDVLRGLQRVLEVLRRHVLAAGGDDDVLLAVGDRQEAVLVDRPDVAGAEPPVARQHLARRLLVLVVAREDRLGRGSAPRRRRRSAARRRAAAGPTVPKRKRSTRLTVAAVVHSVRP